MFFMLNLQMASLVVKQPLHRIFHSLSLRQMLVTLQIIRRRATLPPSILLALVASKPSDRFLSKPTSGSKFQRIINSLFYIGIDSKQKEEHQRLHLDASLCNNAYAMSVLDVSWVA
jgi:hypothetical protein